MTINVLFVEVNLQLIIFSELEWSLRSPTNIMCIFISCKSITDKNMIVLTDISCWKLWMSLEYQVSYNGKTLLKRWKSKERCHPVLTKLWDWGKEMHYPHSINRCVEKVIWIVKTNPGGDNSQHKVVPLISLQCGTFGTFCETYCRNKGRYDKCIRQPWP